MRLATHARRRDAFTLIELLVVISIIVLLIGLSSAALMKTMERQSFARTGEQVDKLQKALAAEIGEVNKKARRDEVPQPVLDYCDGDATRARCVLVAMTQRRDFPQTFTEALTPSYITQDTGGVYHLRVGTVPGGEGVVYTHKANPVFQNAQTGVASLPTTLSATEQSGILLYIILTQKSNTGGAMGADGDSLTNAMRVTIQGREAFADGFKNAIGFNRWEAGSEVQGADYVDQKLALRDPFDPAPNVVARWNTTPAKRSEMAALGFTVGTATSPYRVASVYSLGKDKVPSQDDVFGFRTQKLGNKGY